MTDQAKTDTVYGSRSRNANDSGHRQRALAQGSQWRGKPARLSLREIAQRNTRPALVVGAMATVCLVWGSTYLAIRLAVRPSHGAGLPPLLMGAARFLLAGSLLFALTVRRPPRDGCPDPLGRQQWLAAFFVGIMLPCLGNGLVILAEVHIDSGTAAVALATVPVWTNLLAASRHEERLTAGGVVGILLGLAGVAGLTMGASAGKSIDGAGVALALGAALSWAGGSYYSRSAPLPRRPLVMTAMQMLCGGAGLLVFAAMAGELSRLRLRDVPPSSWLALIYLVLPGSILAYTAYAWLLRNVRLPLVTAYTYVSPVVAILLGWLIVGELLSLQQLVPAVVIFVGVALIVVGTRAVANPMIPTVSGDRLDT